MMSKIALPRPVGNPCDFACNQPKQTRAARNHKSGSGTGGTRDSRPLSTPRGDEGEEPDAGEAQPLVEPGHILLVARQTVERLGWFSANSATLEDGKRSFLARLHQPAVADHIRGQDGGKATSWRLCRHSEEP